MLISKLAVFFERFKDDLRQFRGQFGIQSQWIGGFPVQNGFEYQTRCRTAKRQDACRHFVQNHTKGKYIGALIEVLATHLLGRHIRDGSQCAARAGEIRMVYSGRSSAHSYGVDLLEHYLGKTEMEVLYLLAAGHTTSCR